MKQILRYLALLLVMAFAVTGNAANFDTSKTYVIDTSGCGWFANKDNDMDTYIYIQEGGTGEWHKATMIDANHFSYKPTQANKSTWNIGRANDNKISSGPWNTISNVSAVDGKTYYESNAEFSTGTWYQVRIAGSFIATGTWGNSPTTMTWDETKGAYKYVANANGSMMVSLDDSFWSGRYEGINGGSISIPSSKPSNANIKKGGNVDFTLPAAGTVYFIPWENKIWYEKTTPTETTYTSYKLNSNFFSSGWDQRNFTGKSYTALVGDITGEKQFTIAAFKSTGGDPGHFKPATEVITESGTYDLTGDNDGKIDLTNLSQVKFDLTTDANGKPTKVKITLTKQTTTNVEWYLRGHVTGISDSDYNSEGLKFTKQADGSYVLKGVKIQTKDNNGGFDGAYVYLYNGTHIGPVNVNTKLTVGTITIPSNNSNNWKIPTGTYDFKIVGNQLTVSEAAMSPGILGDLGNGWSDSDVYTEGWTQLNDNEWSYTITPSKDGDIKFKIKYGSTGNLYYAAPNDSGDVTVVNGTSYNTYNKGGVSDGKAFVISGVKKDVPYTVKFNTSTKKVTVTWSTRPSSLYFRNTYFEDAKKQTIGMTRRGNTFVYTMNYVAGTEFTFNFTQSSSSYKGYNIYPTTDGTVAVVGSNSTGVKITSNSTGAVQQNVWKFVSDSSLPLTITVDLTNSTAPVIKIEQKAIENGYYLAGGFQNNWDKSMRQMFIPTSDPKVFTVQAKYHEGNAQNPGFKITDKATDDNGVWYSIGDTRIANGVAQDIAGKTEKANMKLNKSAYLKDVLFTLTLGDDGKPASLKADWTGNDPIQISNDWTAYPAGVYSDEAFERYAQWPVMYLKNATINAERETPEYQMTRVSENEYALTFTLRNGDTYVTMYADHSHNGLEIGKQNIDVNTKFGKTHANEGMRAKATCKRDEVTGEWKLTIEPVGNVQDMPFISMVGAEWKQRIDSNLTQALDSTKEGYKTPDGDTKDGWQESWIQYDNRGQVLLDRKGKVMYNTMWPPKNPILFKTEFGDNDFTISSTDISLKAGKTMTGKQWKNEAEEFALFQADDKHQNLDKNQNGENIGKIYKGVLALDDTKTYTLYQVKNVWINGKVKFWTGWGSQRINTGAANWNNNDNWGHFGNNDYSNSAIGGNGQAFEIFPETSVLLGLEHGDMVFNEPTFFKCIDLFIDNDAPHSANTNVMFTELARGGAQIAAVSTNNYQNGNFQAALSHLENMQNGTLKSVVIKAYSTYMDGDREVEEVVNDKVFTWKPGATPTLNKDFYTIFSSQTASSGLPTTGVGFNSPASKGKWVQDGKEYGTGDYFYRMTVKLTADPTTGDDGKTVEGQEYTVTVDSNPFSIVTKEKLELTVFQLVKKGDRELENGVRQGVYYTYRTDGDPNTPVEPIYEITIDNDDKFDGKHYNFEYDQESNLEYDGDGNVIGVKDENGNLTGGYVDDTNYVFKYRNLTDDEIAELDYSSNDLQFTDKILIVGSVPSANVIEGYQFGADNADATPASVRRNGPRKSNEGADTEEWDRSTMQSEYGDRFMHVTQVGNFNQRQFNLTMRYGNVVYNSDGTQSIEYINVDAPVANYTAVVPEPTLTAAEVQTKYSTDDPDQDTWHQTFTYRGLELPGAHYHSVRDNIVVDFPNVSRYLAERMRIRDFFSIKLKGGDGVVGVDSISGNTTWQNIFEFGEADADNNFGTVTGPVMAPVNFNKTRTISLEKKDGFQYLNRGWEDSKITPLYITDNAPVMLKHEILENKTKLYYDDNWNAIVEFTLLLKHDDTYNPSDPASKPSNEENNHNYIYHLGKDLDGNIYTDKNGNTVEIKTDTQGNPVFDEAYADAFQHDHLSHHSEHDYYYVAIVDRNSFEGDYDEEQDYSDDIIIAEQSTETGEDGTNNTVYTINFKKPKYGYSEGQVLGENEKVMHFAIPATEILYVNGSSEHDGYPITIRVNYGKRPDGSFYTYQKDSEFLYKIVGDEHYAKRIDVHTSYLYPFATEKKQEVRGRNGIRKVVSDYTGDVLKSKADVTGINGEFTADNVVTELKNIADDFGGVSVGEGYIDVEGQNVMIVTTDGKVVAEGEGRHYVGAGIYMVRYNGNTEKVVVK
ncbi:MAG: hypothetical protein K2M87_04530 [Muribaculaceae bacterium]|nr:hypothetical protein [Muribaculaceae bacterium]